MSGHFPRSIGNFQENVGTFLFFLKQIPNNSIFFSKFPQHFQHFPGHYLNFPNMFSNFQKIPKQSTIKLLVRASEGSGGPFPGVSRGYPWLPGVTRDHQNHPGGPPEPLFNFPGNFSRGPSPGHFRETSRKHPGTFQEISGKFSRYFRDISGTIQGHFQDMSWTFCGNFRTFLGNF